MLFNYKYDKNNSVNAGFKIMIAQLKPTKHKHAFLFKIVYFLYNEYFR